MSHTPTPWAIAQSPYDELQETFPIVGGDGFRVAVTANGNKLRNNDTHKANAEYIVRAVNAHADLLAALEAIVKEAPHAGKDERPTGTIDTMVWLARAAIAKARAQ